MKLARIGLGKMGGNISRRLLRAGHQETGYTLLSEVTQMIGCSREVVELLKPFFIALAPAPDQGWGHVGPVGAGHYAKVIHNRKGFGGHPVVPKRGT